MIEFDYKLPSMNIEGRHNGRYNNPEMVLPCVLTTTDTKLGDFLHQLHNTVHDDRTLVFVDGRVLMCSINWIRDYVHEMKAFKHWEYNMKGFLQFILDTQREDGCFYELIKQYDDYHWKFVNEDCRIIYEEDNEALVRLEVEADIEYLMVEGAVQYYRATGEWEWLKEALPKLEKGIEYMISNPKRWNPELGLVIRAYTIDTWDFTSNPASASDRRIHDDEPMCAMHGDNSGVYQAMEMLAWINEKAGNHEKAVLWEERAENLKENMFKYLWNGSHFVHQFCIDHPPVDENENIRLSLSNTYDMNRGVTNLEQSRSIIEEYRKRRETTKAFAEWFSIDPPYPKFNLYEAGEYVNGAISPFTAAELAKAAFENGYEEYGWDILQRVMNMVERDENIFFLYHPETGMPQGRGPSGWGAATLMNTVDEGLAGIVDRDCLYRVIDFSPRFVVTDYTELRYITGYEAAGKFVDVRFVRKDNGMRYDIYSDTEQINAHILLPKGKICEKVLFNGEEIKFEHSRIADSVYVDFAINTKERKSMEIIFA